MDTRKREDSSLAITKKRAITIKQQLFDEFGTNSDSYKTKGYGVQKPLVKKDIANQGNTWEERNKLHASNNRLELKVLAVRW